MEDVMKSIMDTYETCYSAWFLNRCVSQNEGKTQDRIQLFDAEYRDLAISIMEQTREKFLTTFKSFGYKKGTAKDILAEVLNGNTSFVADTQKLFK